MYLKNDSKNLMGIKKMMGSQLFATSWLGPGFAETPITMDKREIKDSPKLPSSTSFIHETLGAIAINLEYHSYVVN